MSQGVEGSDVEVLQPIRSQLPRCYQQLHLLWDVQHLDGGQQGLDGLAVVRQGCNGKSQAKP